MLAMLGCDGEDKKPATKPSTEPVGASAEGYLGQRAVPVVYAPQKPAPKPQMRLPKDASCVTAACHGDMTRAAQIHGPVAQRSCDVCHGEDTGTHHFPLKRDPVATCTFCHQVSGTQSHQHKALEKGCLTCHNPHTANTKFLLKADSVGQQCAQCHTIDIHRFAHAAVAKGQCTNCHWPHQSDTAKLLRGGEGPQHCLSCHDKIRDGLANAAYKHEPAQQDCKRCHQPHTGDFPRLLRARVQDTCLSCHKDIAKHIADSPVQHSAIFIKDGCGNCHDPHAAPEKNLLRARADALCLTCHDKPITAVDGHLVANMKPVLTESKFLHGPIRSGSCAGCHDPHGGKRPHLLDFAFPTEFYTSFAVEKYELCFRCHKSDMVTTEHTTALTGFRDGDRNLHFVHVNRDQKGRSCRTCHEIHGSNLPRHMASEVPFEGSNWSMPIKFEQKPSGGSCAPGCHTPQTYDRLKPTTLPATRGDQ